MRMLCLLFFYVLFSSICLAGSTDDREGMSLAESSTYIFGVVPQFEQRKLFRIWRPILTELERITGFHFVLKGSSKIPAFEDRFMAGGFDLAYMNPYHLVIASDSQGYLPLVRDGAKKLNGILVVHRDSGINTVEDLRGQVIAFPSPNALGASLLMRDELKTKFNLDFSTKYVQTHSSVYLHVVKDLVSAGGGVARTLYSQKELIQRRLKVIYKTREISPHPIAVHPRVPIAHQQRIQQALLGIAENERGRKLFSEVPIAKITTASMDDYKNIMGWGLEHLYVP